MRMWRMAFRAGEGGPEMWPLCLKYGVAAITYYPLGDTNLTRFPKNEPRELWAELSSSQKYSLRKVAYEMKKGDTIFAKQGAHIIGKGIVRGQYRFDASDRIVSPNGFPWRHQVPVKWLSDFQPVRASVGDQQRWTVRELSRSDVTVLGSRVAHEVRAHATEGELVRQEAAFRKRNAALIAAKKANSDYRCEVCGFSFEEAYGEVGQHFIIAHHITPISRKSRPSKTSLDDIALLCANCHSIIHLSEPILSVARLAGLIRR